MSTAAIADFTTDLPRHAPRARVPTVMQQESAECGAACLAMVLGRFGLWVSLEELRDRCQVNRDGTNSANILTAARSYGLEAQGLKQDIEDLPSADLPMILFWNFNHFVVLERITRSGAWINDPATGPRRVTLAEFDRCFTGVALRLRPGPDFRPGGHRPSLAGIVLRTLGEARIGLIYAIIAGIALLVPGLAVMGSYRIFTDDILIGGESRWLMPLLIGLIAAGCLTALLTYAQKNVLARMETSLSASMSLRYLWTVMRLPLDFFAQRYSGDITNRITQAEQMSSVVSSGLAVALVGIVPIIGYGVALLLIDPMLASIVFGGAVLAVVLLFVASRLLQDANRRAQNDNSRLQGLTLQGLSMRDDFRAAGSEGLFHKRWQAAQARVLVGEQTTGRANLWVSEAAALILALAGIGVLVVGGLRIMEGALSIGLLISARALMSSFSSPVVGLVDAGAQLQSVRGITERLADAMNHNGAAAPAPSNTSVDTPAATAKSPVAPASDLPQSLKDAAHTTPKPADGPLLPLRACNITFRYEAGSVAAVQDVSLSLGESQRIALVGGSGSGKSSLGRVLVGLATPESGHIDIYGQPLDADGTARTHGQVAYVGQTVDLFGDTVQDNITLWDDTMPEEQVIAAAQDACIHDVITARAGGYLARLSENGGNMSGGERQRLGIARALVGNPRILVLDEATSALDPTTELRVLDALRRRGCATVIISHRLGSIASCDVIHVMEAGRIVESGNHRTLLRRGGMYSKMVGS
ncbi:cysteine peptidase family C39 domain-containing protein [Phaeobacter sp. J2-8]|uniref:cysteine peptidase family C39 domain-containing protein n=1 Tax=Phaeobacter sp. J2-8 TaxID=2931394 RepID=UPI001FD41C42|nr:cysteine peptidase family C39 domain-containing protein [Phaeobacter sp. J2-8]MCJ7873485.1 cysteine peptidase family C39 domain-containing protein [Phaeobacter sp. J2-8]